MEWRPTSALLPLDKTGTAFATEYTENAETPMTPIAPGRATAPRRRTVSFSFELRCEIE
jgi:hypothetical protein